MHTSAQRSTSATPLPPEDLHQILQEWSDLITSLANLIRENVEGLLPAVFGLASLANRASEAQLDAAGQARDAEAALRSRVQALRSALAPLARETAGDAPLHVRLAEIAREAQALRARADADPALAAFLDRLVGSEQAILPAAGRLAEAGSSAADGMHGTLEALESELAHAGQRLQDDNEQLQAAAARVRQFAESSKTAIDQLILKLQFQDRTDQILSHLKTDFESLSQALSMVGEQAFDAERWRQERMRRFTTIEERSGGQSLSTDSGDIELF